MMAKKKGRPVGSTRLTKGIREAIIKGIRLGLTYDRAARLAGIHPRTFYLWKQKGAQGKAPVYVHFLQALKKAEVEGEAAAINQIVKAAKDGTWQAAAWLLERRFPQRWSRVQKLEVTWQAEIINLVQTGAVTIDDVREELGEELVRELFESTSVQIGKD